MDTKILRTTSTLLLAFALIFAGCESSDDTNWSQAAAPVEATTDAATDAAAGDAVAFSSLNFSYGGFNGSSAQISSATIGNLRVSNDGLSYSWVGDDLSAWGLSDGDSSGALACFFIKENSGGWNGGKMDWISSSRTSRDFHNITTGYHGWTLSKAPNPCEVAFVIVSKDGRKRTNVISTTWHR